MCTIALLNCGLFLFLLSDFQLSYQQDGRFFTLALIVAILVMLLVHLCFLPRSTGMRRLPFWMTLPYALFITGMGLMILLDHLADDPYWYTFGLFTIGCVCVVVAVFVAVAERRPSREAGSSLGPG